MAALRPSMRSARTSRKSAAWKAILFPRKRFFLRRIRRICAKIISDIVLDQVTWQYVTELGHNPDDGDDGIRDDGDGDGGATGDDDDDDEAPVFCGCGFSHQNISRYWH